MNEKRLYERLNCSLQAYLQVGHPCSSLQLAYPTIIKNISRGGIYFESELPIDHLIQHLLEENLTSFLKFHQTHTSTLLPIKALWVHTLEKHTTSATMGIGATFRNPLSSIDWVFQQSGIESGIE